MKADFLDAHKRHWEDAELLFNEKHWANADHLYGLAAECGLKQLMMIIFGMKVDAHTGSPSDKSDKVHVESAWNRYRTYSSGINATGYLLPSANPFQNWNISQRYASQTNFSEVVVKPHQNGAKIVNGFVHKAILDGFL